MGLDLSYAEVRQMGNFTLPDPPPAREPCKGSTDRLNNWFATSIRTQGTATGIKVHALPECVSDTFQREFRTHALVDRDPVRDDAQPHCKNVSIGFKITADCPFLRQLATVIFGPNETDWPIAGSVRYAYVDADTAPQTLPPGRAHVDKLSGQVEATYENYYTTVVHQDSRTAYPAIAGRVSPEVGPHVVTHANFPVDGKVDSCTGSFNWMAIHAAEPYSTEEARSALTQRLQFETGFSVGFSQEMLTKRASRQVVTIFWADARISEIPKLVENATGRDHINPPWIGIKRIYAITETGRNSLEAFEDLPVIAADHWKKA